MQSRWKDSGRRARLDTIRGVNKRTAEVIIAEIGVDMRVFLMAGHLAGWAGLCPGNNETYADSSTTTYGWNAGNRLTQTSDSLAGTITRTYDLLPA